MSTAQATSFHHLMDLDEAGQLDAAKFDNQLWLMLILLIRTPEQAQTFGEAVWVYYASRSMEWEVGNGGFAQAAYNMPEWFPLAAQAYRILGLEAAAKLIDYAYQIVIDGENRNDKFTAKDIGELFGQFAESPLAELNSHLDEVGWWADEQRLNFVRQHRNAFRAID